MDRKPSTTIDMPRRARACPRLDRDKALWAEMFEAARSAHSNWSISGVVGLHGRRAWFQEPLNPTPYSIVLSDEELKMFL